MATISEPMARHYRNLRSGYLNGGQPMPARAAWLTVKASARGHELAMDSEQTTWHGDFARHWHEEIGAGIAVDVWQVADYETCDCWEDAENYPGGQGEEIPEHGHFGIVAEASWHGQLIPSHGIDACWGFIWDWPGQDDDAELAWAWDDIAQPVIDGARDALAKVPAWVLEQVAAWDA